jgi:cytochrome c oxidase subunit 3
MSFLDEHERRMLEHTILSRDRLEEQYRDFEQQNQTAQLGMWLFLATEIMFFGVLFTALAVYRYLYGEAFELASRKLSWQFATANTVVLLLSSLTMALAVAYLKRNRQRPVFWCLVATVLLACGFLIIKGCEYYQDYREGLILGSQFRPGDWLQAGLTKNQLPQVQLFLLLYWLMTGLHGVHVLIGIGVISVIAALSKRGLFDADYYGPVEAVGLYWHFVDIVWIFLFPLLYLQGTHFRP